MIPLAALDVAALTTFTGPIVVLAGVVFLALRYNREETGKTVEQQTAVLGNMREVYEALKESLTRAETERDAARLEADKLRAEVAAARAEIAGLRAEIAGMRAEMAEYQRRRDSER